MNVNGKGILFAPVHVHVQFKYTIKYLLVVADVQLAKYSTNSIRNDFLISYVIQHEKQRSKISVCEGVGVLLQRTSTGRRLVGE